MKVLFAASALLAVTIGIGGTTFAQAQNAPVYRYCLLEGGGGIARWRRTDDDLPLQHLGAMHGEQGRQFR